MDTAQKKERQPISPGVSGVMEEVGEPPRISEELQKLGVEPVSPDLQLAPVHEQIGIRPAGAVIPFSIEPEGLVELPLTGEEARQVLKIHKNVADAAGWLARWVLRQLEKLRIRKGQEAYLS